MYDFLNLTELLLVIQFLVKEQYTGYIGIHILRHFPSFISMQYFPLLLLCNDHDCDLFYYSSDNCLVNLCFPGS